MQDGEEGFREDGLVGNLDKKSLAKGEKRNPDSEEVARDDGCVKDFLSNSELTELIMLVDDDLDMAMVVLRVGICALSLRALPIARTALSI